MNRLKRYSRRFSIPQALMLTTDIGLAGFLASRGLVKAMPSAASWI